MQTKLFSVLAAGMLLLTAFPGTAFAADAGPQTLYQCSVDTNVPTWQTDHMEGSVYIGHCDAQTNPYFGQTVTDRQFVVNLWKCNVGQYACNIDNNFPGPNWQLVAESDPYSVGLGASDVNHTITVTATGCSNSTSRKYAVQVGGILPYGSSSEFATVAQNVSSDTLNHNCPGL